MPHYYEAFATILLYCAFGSLGVIIISYSLYLRWRVRLDQKQNRRKEHLMEQLALRGREITLLIEELWQEYDKKQ